MNSDNDIEKWKKEYHARYAFQDSFTNKIKEYILNLLNVSKIKCSIEARTKSEESFEDKLLRKGTKYSDPINQIYDLTGIRVITHYKSDASKVANIIDKNFVIDHESSGKKGKKNLSEFSYRCIHEDVKLKQEMKDDKDWASYGDFKFEVQIRTFLEHAWAIVSHDIYYKKRLPDEYVRKMNAFSASLELVDGEFDAIREEINKLTPEKYFGEAYEKSEIDIDGLKEFFQQSKTVKELITYIKSKPFNVGDDLRDNFVNSILKIFKKLGLSSFRKIEEFLSDGINEIKNAFDVWIKNSKWKSYSIDALFIMIFLLAFAPKLDFEAQIKSWDNRFKNIMIKCYEEIYGG